MHGSSTRVSLFLVQHLDILVDRSQRWAIFEFPIKVLEKQCITELRVSCSKPDIGISIVIPAAVILQISAVKEANEALFGKRLLAARQATSPWKPKSYNFRSIFAASVRNYRLPVGPGLANF